MQSDPSSDARSNSVRLIRRKVSTGNDFIGELQRKADPPCIGRDWADRGTAERLANHCSHFIVGGHMVVVQLGVVRIAGQQRNRHPMTDSEYTGTRRVRPTNSAGVPAAAVSEDGPPVGEFDRQRGRGISAV
jgi:hypothetical protein